MLLSKVNIASSIRFSLVLLGKKIGFNVNFLKTSVY